MQAVEPRTECRSRCRKPLAFLQCFVANPSDTSRRGTSEQPCRRSASRNEGSKRPRADKNRRDIFHRCQSERRATFRMFALTDAFGRLLPKVGR